jgi:glycosyltransferase involved in cell wall biosynthesis
VNTVRQDATVLIIEEGEGLWGAQRYLLRLAPLLEARGFHQVLAAPPASATTQAWRQAGHLHVDLAVPANRGVRAANASLSPKLALRELGRTIDAGRHIARLVRSTHADIIHANSHWSHFEAVLASKLTGRPAVLHLHEESAPDVIGKLRTLAVLGSAAAIAVSEAVASSLPAIARKRTVVIRNGVDTRVMCPGPASPTVRSELTSELSSPVVLVLCRLDVRKGVDDVIHAVAKLPPHLSGTALAIAGAPSLDPWNGERLRHLGSELLGPRVRFLGPRSDVPDLLRAADALVLASTQEGLPLSILEAQACGLPVVVYPTAGIPEVVVHGETGMLAVTGNIDDLSTQLARVLSDPVLHKHLSVEGRKRVLLESALEVQADRHAALLGAIVERRSVGRKRRSPAPRPS